MKAVKNTESANHRELNTTNLLEECGLSNVNCDMCGNTGLIHYKKDGYDYSRECECMKARRSLRSIKSSGMEDMLTRYTFGEYKTPDAKREELKKSAMDFVANNSGWFYISGNPGSGKSHLCAAICRELIIGGKEVSYMTWRDDVTHLKSVVNEPEYEDRMRRLKHVDVLYIDDFLKGKVTPADINLAFELLNARYNDSKLITVISSERDLNDVIEIDEAVGSRIYERSMGYCKKAPKDNWRLNSISEN